MVAFEEVLHKLQILAVALFVAALIISIAKPLIKRQRRKKQSMLIETSWSNRKGIVFGKNRLGRIVQSPADKEGHVLVVGGSGAGKTSAILIPTLQKICCNFFALDISGDITAKVQRDDIIVYNPLDPSTVPYDVFALIDSLGDEDERLEQLEKLAFLIMPDSPNASEASHFFNSEGRRILTAALLAFYSAGMDFVDICKKIISLPCVELFKEIDSQGSEIASYLISSFRGTNEANTAGCKQAVDAAVKLFALNSKISGSMRRPDDGEIAFYPTILERLNVIVRIPETMLDVYAPLLNIIVAQCLTYFASREEGAKPNIFFALDEFASLGKMDVLGALRRLRKRNVRVMLIIQSIADIELNYSEKERQVIVDNCMFKVILGVTDATSQEEFAKMIGHKKGQKFSTTSGDSGSSYTKQEEDVWAVEPEKLSKLGNELILIHPAGYSRIKKAPYYKYEA